MLVIGFTGTRKGMTDKQKERLRALLRVDLMMPREPLLGLHGDCVGSDAEFDAICGELGIPTSCYPSDMESMRAQTGAKVLAEPMPPLRRNDLIMNDSAWLYACPDGPERVRSGTWSTVRKMVKGGKAAVVIMPNGDVVSARTQSVGNDSN